MFVLVIFPERMLAPVCKDKLKDKLAAERKSQVLVCSLMPLQDQVFTSSQWNEENENTGLYIKALRRTEVTS